ncbi:HEAT repeat domain-containing protein [Shewanella sp. 10N.286.48.A6]|uniref:HEAT repeat domain-containing protein n=1 Tax=Shewanella sp. 10N.286.48.A6 TaxID=1880833 RepID=UPI0012FFD70C|nr:HEAT repeat domain-containing protein [Shewanella sp. 10N.286.48.A6]
MNEIVAQLGDKKSPKRRSAAKKLRKLKDVDAGPHLLAALEAELKDVRTWETQYQMIMAIGECGYKPALPFINELAKQDFEATMVYVAIGDAIVRLSIENERDAAPIFKLLDTGNEMLIDGALRAMAMLKMVPSDSHIEKIINYVAARELNQGIHFWVVAAAPGWSGAKVEEYLDYCAKSPREEITSAVALARKNKYKKWSPL